MSEATNTDHRSISILDWSLSLLIGVGTVGWLLYFYQDFSVDNQQFAKGVCCGFTDAVFDATLKMERGESIDFSKGYASYIAALWWRWMDRSPASLLMLSQGAHVLTGLLVVVAGALRKKPLIGVLGAVAIWLMPINMYASLRWDVYSLQGPLIVVGWICVYWSRGFTSVLPSIGFVGVVWLSAFWSFRETDNLIVLLTHASIAFGFWVSSLWFSQDSESRSVPRWWSAGIGLLTCGLILWQIASYWQFSSPEGLQYYFREADDPMMASRVTLTPSLQWFGYWGHLYWRAFGPVVAGAILVSGLWLLLFRKMSFGLLFGILIPYVVLSWISKRNFYYPSALWIILPLILGEGLLVVSNPWWRRIIFCTGISICCWNIQQRLDDVELMGDEQYGGLFQTSDGNISLEPKPFWGVDDLADRIASHIQNNGCTTDQIVVLEGNAMIEEVALRLGSTHPCIQFKRQLQNRDARVLQTVQMWVIDPKNTQIETSWLEQEGFEFDSTVLMDNRFRLNVWSR